MAYNESRNDAAAKEKAIDDWLPITSSRKAKWWYSTFHNVTAMVGAGVLSLPYAMAQLGWGPGIAILVLSWVITLYTLWQMVEMHEMVPGKRFDRYHELGQHVFGDKLGLWIVVPQQLIVQVGVNIVYMVTGGKSLKKFHDVVCPNCKDIRLTYFIMIFASVQMILAHLPNLNSISVISLAAAVMSLSYSTIAWASTLNKGVQPDVDYSYKARTRTGAFFDFITALGDVAFAYAGHNVVLEIQATIPSSPEKPSKKPMWRGAFLAYLVVAFCYFPVALIGYWCYGNSVDDNILISLQKPSWLIAAANMFVVIHVIGSYQIYAIAVFDLLETALVKKLHFSPSFMLRFVTRTVYVGLTMFVGICIPFFNGLLSFFGGFAFAPTTYFPRTTNSSHEHLAKSDYRAGQIRREGLSYCISYNLKPSSIVSSWEIYYLNRQLYESTDQNGEMDGLLLRLQNELKEAVVKEEPNLHI
ncbi:hypothetical protein NC653_021702 [Populus alba x Populus x berolinensis]|uniref:Amino acid transporter transmembrane domain-containing protein n=1 Tax=Populus alba x Populus x berolinensis TaxID=444605 RepID=A0AAD6MQ61_9ROSI|nr:hypothetical protein NC653_021702 [Populus alba x Populus x berolinensis]